MTHTGMSKTAPKLIYPVMIHGWISSENMAYNSILPN